MYTIQQGFSDTLRHSAAVLYDAAFGAKLSIALPDTAQRMAILEKGLEPDYAFVALQGGDIVGIAGFKTAQGSFTGGISFELLSEVLGPIAAIRAMLLLMLLDRQFVADQLLMDGIAVAPQMRGSGIGTRLLNRLIEYAEAEGYHSLRLDVIDSNPAAQRLYTRVGFVAVKTHHFAYLKKVLGFSAATQMEYGLLK